jgi:cytochrome c oxidase assembly protein subunit 15
MTDRARRFARYAWVVLAWNALVVLWGAFVRATGSGAGCGEHWPLCNGAVLPRSPALTTIIEFLHRITSGVALIAVAALVVWSVRAFPRGHRARRWAWTSLAFLIVEALLGAGLVLLSYVEKNASAGRAVYLCAHLTNTLLLLGAIAGTAWFAREARWSWRAVPGLQWAALAAVLAAGTTGVIAALGDTIWPAVSMVEGLRQEVAGTAPLLLRLRLIHPVVAVASGALLVLTAVLSLRLGQARRWLIVLALVQLIAGGVNVLLLAPVWMQILHLALAVGVWLALVIGCLEQQA